jgi:putative addiction module component (TIGR02574 family)
MNQSELLEEIESLPVDEQFVIAKKVIDRLANDGAITVSEKLKSEFLRREEEFYRNPNSGQSWSEVRQDIFQDREF